MCMIVDIRHSARFLTVLALPLILSLAAQSQTRWMKHPDNPVLRVSRDDSRDPFAYQYLYAPSVIKDPSGRGYLMWFASLSLRDSRWCISHAISPDGITWYHYDRNSVLKTDEVPAFDSQWLIDPDVIRLGDRYFMYYAGHDGVAWKGGLATSSDGRRWVRSARNPLLVTVPGSWESVTCGAQHTVLRDGIFYAFYEGYDGVTRQTGLANSMDGETWTKFPGNPVLGAGPPGAWDAAGAKPLSVYLHRGIFHLLYNTEPDGKIGLATSENGALWRKYPGNPILVPGGPGTWDASMSCASVMLDGDSLRLWYGGYGPAGSGWYNAWQIGYAVAPIDTTVLSVNGDEKGPDRFSSIENYPNPFNTSTVVTFDVPRRASVRIKVYDVLGREITTLANDVFSPGRHAVRFDAEGQASGTYYCREEVRFEDDPGHEVLRAVRALVLVR